MGRTLPRTVVVHEAPGAGRLAAAIEERLPDIRVGTLQPDDLEPTDLDDVRVLVTFEPPRDLGVPEVSPRWIHALTAGVDGYDIGGLRERGVVLTNASGVGAEPVAEQVLGYLLTFERRLHRAVRQQVEGEWDWFGGRELRDETVGIVGVGAIGGRVAELLDAVGAETLGLSRHPASMHPAVDEAYGTGDLTTLLERSDYVVLTCPLTDETRGLVGASELARMRDHAVLVNVGRGGLVDQDALVAALREGTIRGAALDVFEREPLPTDSPLWERSDVVLTPHNAGSTPNYWRRNADLFARNYRRFVAGDLDDLVNRVV
ncbi:D-2-hydroxyacid dehydrogenase [Haloglomus litoreum]|uniref:D-2-hydroxyacid dehydrogenase n=1 Tax=Haloglomus litoreum TaxID=3034026 RepID=UPI0023E85516|nr:D-2-hydroxyacid dehydrogenase [Haloglomus sp. DT116]